jgi:hypothetical protein
MRQDHPYFDRMMSLHSREEEVMTSTNDSSYTAAAALASRLLRWPEQGPCLVDEWRKAGAPQA